MRKSGQVSKGILFISAISIFSFPAIAQFDSSTQRSWMNLPVDMQSCMHSLLRSNRSSITEKIQQGISPNDSSLSPMMSTCRSRVESDRIAQNKRVKELEIAENNRIENEKKAAELENRRRAVLSDLRRIRSELISQTESTRRLGNEAVNSVSFPNSMNFKYVFDLDSINQESQKLKRHDLELVTRKDQAALVISQFTQKDNEILFEVPENDNSATTVSIKSEIQELKNLTALLTNELVVTQRKIEDSKNKVTSIQKRIEASKELWVSVLKDENFSKLTNQRSMECKRGSRFRLFIENSVDLNDQRQRRKHINKVCSCLATAELIEQRNVSYKVGLRINESSADKETAERENIRVDEILGECSTNVSPAMFQVWENQP